MYSGSSEAVALQARLAAFIRAFGLHQPERTPCGVPIPVSEAHAMLELERDGPMAQHELGARLRLEKSTVSRLVGQLESRGWVARSRGARDGRVTMLELTDAGRQSAVQLGAARADRFTRLLEAIPPDERTLVLDGLTILVEALRDDQ
jgi:DNA-binding MarR family transcriptional regulator